MRKWREHCSGGLCDMEEDQGGKCQQIMVNLSSNTPSWSARAFIPSQEYLAADKMADIGVAIKTSVRHSWPVPHFWLNAGKRKNSAMSIINNLKLVKLHGNHFMVLITVQIQPFHLFIFSFHDDPDGMSQVCLRVCVPMLMENFLDIQYDTSCLHFPTYSFQN